MESVLPCLKLCRGLRSCVTEVPREPVGVASHKSQKSFGRLSSQSTRSCLWFGLSFADLETRPRQTPHSIRPSTPFRNAGLPRGTKGVPRAVCVPLEFRGAGSFYAETN